MMAQKTEMEMNEDFRNRNDDERNGQWDRRIIYYGLIEYRRIAKIKKERDIDLCGEAERN
jgi:hypothetical protein